MRAQAWLPDRIEIGDDERPRPVGERTSFGVPRLPADIYFQLLIVLDFSPSDPVGNRYEVDILIVAPDGQDWHITFRHRRKRKDEFVAFSLVDPAKLEGARKAGRHRVEVRTPASRDPIELSFVVELLQ